MVKFSSINPQWPKDLLLIQPEQITTTPESSIDRPASSPAPTTTLVAYSDASFHSNGSASGATVVCSYLDDVAVFYHSFPITESTTEPGERTPEDPTTHPQ